MADDQDRCEWVNLVPPHIGSPVLDQGAYKVDVVAMVMRC